MSRRRESLVVSCISCGAVLCIYVDGEMPKPEAHACPFSSLNDMYEADEIRAEIRAGKGEVHD